MKFPNLNYWNPEAVEVKVKRFILPDDPKVRHVRIKWPGEYPRKLNNLSLGRLMLLNESSGIDGLINRSANDIDERLTDTKRKLERECEQLKRKRLRLQCEISEAPELTHDIADIDMLFD